MNIEELRDYCLLKKGTSEDFPFDESILVFKVEGKIFALVNIDEFEFINLKCNPEKAIELRERYNGVLPGYHMNKKHWNSVLFNSDVSPNLLIQLIDHSYDVVVQGLPKKLQEKLR